MNELTDPQARRLWAQVEAGFAVVASLRSDAELIEHAKAHGRLVKIDRSSPWGNPYRMAREADRAEVCSRYELEHLPSRPDLLDQVADLRGRVLACWCSPKPCHGDTLARLANEGKR